MLADLMYGDPEALPKFLETRRKHKGILCRHGAVHLVGPDRAVSRLLLCAQTQTADETRSIFARGAGALGRLAAASRRKSQEATDAIRDEGSRFSIIDATCNEGNLFAARREIRMNARATVPRAPLRRRANRNADPRSGGRFAVDTAWRARRRSSRRRRRKSFGLAPSAEADTRFARAARSWRLLRSRRPQAANEKRAVIRHLTNNIQGYRLVRGDRRVGMADLSSRRRRRGANCNSSSAISPPFP